MLLVMDESARVPAHEHEHAAAACAAHDCVHDKEASEEKSEGARRSRDP